MQYAREPSIPETLPWSLRTSGSSKEKTLAVSLEPVNTEATGRRVKKPRVSRHWSSIWGAVDMGRGKGRLLAANEDTGL